MYRTIYDWFKVKDLKTMVALECGSHLFQDTIPLSNIFKHVYTFEANPTVNVPFLPSNVTFVPQALANYTGTVPFYVEDFGDGGASSLLPAQGSYLHDYVKSERPVNVPCTTLHDVMTQHQIPKIDFFWLDMEGYELEFLKSVDLSTVSYVYTEVNFQPFRKHGCLYKDIVAYMQQQKFVEVYSWIRGDWNGDVLFQKNTNTEC